MFKGKTIIERLNSSEYAMRSSLIFENAEFKVQVKKGFVTGGASIPPYMWSVIGCPFSGKYVGSAIIHDALYATHKLTKEESDKLFLHMMEDNGVKKWKRTVMYLAVKLLGNASWDELPESVEKYSPFVVVTRKK